MTTPFRKNVLAGAITCVSALATTGALAQDGASSDQSGHELEEILVTGIKQSLQRAQDFKREQVGVVDAISAEGLGNFPDTNIAESLQRIPGVAIDRNGGEGQFVTVRGFGPAFNTVLVNDRRIVSETGGREFSFDLYPAELISGAEIYKSGVASLQEGGIGSTINLKTVRPLELNQDKYIFSVEALVDNDSDETTPQLFALASKVFNDGRTGALVSVSYQERDSQEDFTNTNGWLPRAIGNVPLAEDANANPGNVDTAFIPRETQSGRRFQSRERLNIQGVLQHDVTDDLRLTLDGFYNEFDVESDTKLLGSWFGDVSAIDNVILNENGTVIREDIASEVGILNRLEGRQTETKAIGFNLNWNATSEIEAILDVSYNETEAPQTDDNGQGVMGFTDEFSFDNTGGVAEVIYPQSVVDKITNKDSFNAHVAQFGDQAGDGTGGNSVEGEIFEVQLKGIYRPEEGGYLKNIKFGTSFSEQEKTVDIIRPDFDVFCLFCFFNIDVPNELITEFDNSGLLSGIAPNTQKEFFGFNLKEYIAWQSSPEGLAALDEFVANGGTPAVPLPPEFDNYQEFFEAQPGGFFGTRQPDSFAIEETIFSAYFDMNFEGEIASVPWSINTGVRWVWTEDEVEGSQQELIGLSITDPDATQYQTVFSDEGSGFQTETNSYRKLLPNFALSVRPTENLVARLAVSETLTRPQLDDLAPRFSFLDLRPSSLEAVGGNVNLEPFTSTNIDLSLEYYFGDINFVTIAYFDKEVDNFIVNSSETVTISGIDVTTVIEDPLVDPEAGTAEVNVQRPLNAEVAKVDGWEIAAQYAFDFLPGPLSGLGVSGNLTFVDSNASIGSDDSVDTLFALPGLGHSKNAAVFYEKGPVEARIAWNWRDEFLETLVNPKAGVEPVFVKEFEQVDAKLNFHINENFSIFFEGVNLFDEELEKHGRFEEQFILHRTTGPRYSVGLRAQF